MSRLTAGIIGIFLVPCLIADPALATGPGKTSPGSSGSDPSCLARQALAPPGESARKMLPRERPLGKLVLALAGAIIGGAAVYGWYRLKSSPARMTRSQARRELLGVDRWIARESARLEMILRPIMNLRPDLGEEIQNEDESLRIFLSLRKLIEVMWSDYRRAHRIFSPFVTAEFEGEMKNLDEVRQILLEIWDAEWLEIVEREVFQACWNLRGAQRLERMLGLFNPPKPAPPIALQTQSA